MKTHLLGIAARGFLCILVAVLTVGLIWGAPASDGGACPPTVVDVDSTGWDLRAGTFLGRAIGQTFYAPETLLTKVTVWRPYFASTGGAHLFVTEVNRGENPPRPDTRRILLDGPSIPLFTGEPGEIYELEYSLDPPLVLPGRGLYAFFIQAQYCDIGEVRILSTTKNPYHDGMIWLTNRALSSCFLAPADRGEDTTDIIFRIEYCDAPTPAKRKSWGEVKTIYR